MCIFRRNLLAEHDPSALSRVPALLDSHKDKELELFEYLRSVYKGSKIRNHYPEVKSEDEILNQTNVRSSVRYYRSRRNSENIVTNPEDIENGEATQIVSVPNEIREEGKTSMLNDKAKEHSTVPDIQGSKNNSLRTNKKGIPNTQGQKRSFKNRIAKKHETVKLIRNILEEYSPSMNKYADRMLRDFLGREDELLENLIFEFGLTEKRDLLNLKYMNELMINYDNSFEMQDNSDSSDSNNEGNIRAQYSHSNSTSPGKHNTNMNADHIRKLTYYKEHSSIPSPKKNRKGSFRDSPTSRKASSTGNTGVIVPRQSRAHSFTSYISPKKTIIPPEGQTLGQHSTHNPRLPVQLPSPKAHYPNRSPASEVPPHPSPNSPQRTFSFNSNWSSSASGSLHGSSESVPIPVLGPVLGLVQVPTEVLTQETKPYKSNSIVEVRKPSAISLSYPAPVSMERRTTLSQLFPTQSPATSPAYTPVATPPDSPDTRPFGAPKPVPTEDADDTEGSGSSSNKEVTLHLPTNRSSISRASLNNGTSPTSLTTPTSPTAFKQPQVIRNDSVISPATEIADSLHTTSDSTALSESIRSLTLSDNDVTDAPFNAHGIGDPSKPSTATSLHMSDTGEKSYVRLNEDTADLKITSPCTSEEYSSVPSASQECSLVPDMCS